MKYTCVDYQVEMVLIGLKRRLHQEGLSEEEKKAILSQIQKLEAETGID